MVTSATMNFRALHRQFFAGIVLFALLLQTVLPAIAGAASASGERWVEVCAASGVKWVKLDDAASPGKHEAADHCVLCAATGPTPEFDAALFLRSSLADARTTTSIFTSYPTYPSHILRSRAPPYFS